MNVTMALIADYSNISIENKLNILGVFDKIYVQNLPAVHLQTHLVMRLAVGAAERGQEKELTVLVIDADGNEINRVGVSFTVPPDAPLQSSFNQIILLNVLIFPRLGGYSFSILINGDEKATIPFTVEQMPNAESSSHVEG